MPWAFRPHMNIVKIYEGGFLCSFDDRINAERRKERIRDGQEAR